MPADLQKGLLEILSKDPRPQYHQDPTRIYGMAYGGYEVKFRVDENRLIVEDIK
ncbi:MAG: hypothetical protein IKZ23_05060 [Clostridia bacterium]|nr:hypothetical protein [Clostridia bacterium]